MPHVYSGATLSGSLLLTSASAETISRIKPQLEPVTLTENAVLNAAGAPVTDVYFIQSGWVSLVATLTDGQQCEVASIGREGLVGLPLLYGNDSDGVDTIVISPGTAQRLPGRRFRDEMEKNTSFRQQVLSYAGSLQAHVRNVALCNVHHDLEKRLTRWILTAHDRGLQEEIVVTQDKLASLLCAYRPSVSLAAQSLRRAGLIDYHSGKIMVLDRAGLEARACECYFAIRSLTRHSHA